MKPSTVRLFVEKIAKEFPGATAVRRKSADENVIIVRGVSDDSKFEDFISVELLFPLLQEGREPPAVIIDEEEEDS